MIYVNIPYANSSIPKNLGQVYNNFCENLPNDDDWACFLDHDAMFTTDNWYTQIEEIISKDDGSPRVYGARTNRINSTFQLVGNIDIHNHDMRYHREIGKYLQGKHYYDKMLVKTGATLQKGFSGIMILIQKSTWRKINGFIDGFNNVDNTLRYKLNEHNIPLYILNGMYIYHWYKANQPYDRCKEKFKVHYDCYIKNNQPFKYENIFLYNGTVDELPE